MSTATNIIALYAAVVSTASFIVIFFAYRASGPKLTAAAVVIGHDVDKQRLHVTIATGGSSDTTIDVKGLLCTVVPDPGMEKHFIMKRTPRLFKLKLEGPELPYRMPGHDSADWSSDLDDATWHLSRELRPSDEPKVVIRAGSRMRRVPVVFLTEGVIFHEMKRRNTISGTADRESE